MGRSYGKFGIAGRIQQLKRAFRRDEERWERQQREREERRQREADERAGIQTGIIDGLLKEVYGEFVAKAVAAAPSLPDLLAQPPPPEDEIRARAFLTAFEERLRELAWDIPTETVYKLARLATGRIASDPRMEAALTEGDTELPNVLAAWAFAEYLRETLGAAGNSLAKVQNAIEGANAYERGWWGRRAQRAQMRQAGIPGLVDDGTIVGGTYQGINRSSEAFWKNQVPAGAGRPLTKEILEAGMAAAERQDEMNRRFARDQQWADALGDFDPPVEVTGEPGQIIRYRSYDGVNDGGLVPGDLPETKRTGTLGTRNYNLDDE